MPAPERALDELLAPRLSALRRLALAAPCAPACGSATISRRGCAWRTGVSSGSGTRATGRPGRRLRALAQLAMEVEELAAAGAGRG